ncbi:MAG: hypothetical protein AAGK97_17155, partial [Bacteroidota bacterium]
IFLDDMIPEYFQQTDFLKQLDQSLKPNGVLLYNRLAYTKRDKQLSNIFFDKTFKPYFPKGRKLEVHGNYILTNDGSFFH